MNQSLIVKPHLDKAEIDLTAATRSLRIVWDTVDGRVEALELATAVEALGRAIASVSYAVERLAELVVDD